MDVERNGRGRRGWWAVAIVSGFIALASAIVEFVGSRDAMYGIFYGILVAALATALALGKVPTDHRQEGPPGSAGRDTDRVRRRTWWIVGIVCSVALVLDSVWLFTDFFATGHKIVGVILTISLATGAVVEHRFRSEDS